MTTCLACHEKTFDSDPEECINEACPRNQDGWSLPSLVAFAATVATMLALVTRM